MNNYRELKDEDMYPLIGEVIRRRGEDGDRYMVIAVKTYNGKPYAVTEDGNLTAEVLLDEFISESGEPVGIEEELSQDNLALSEFMDLVDNNVTNVEFVTSGGEWRSVKGYTKESFYPLAERALQQYRIKPKIKYIKPKVGWTGTLDAEIKDYDDDEWVPGIVKFAVDEDSSIHRYHAIAEDGMFGYDQCRVLPFSPTNPPPEDTRFKVKNDQSIHFVKQITADYIVTQGFKGFLLSEVEFIDFGDYDDSE